MDLTYSEREEAFRDEARRWLEANVPREPLPSGDTTEGFALHRAWERRLFEARWSVVSWPAAYGGRAASLVVWLLFEEEF
jgi:alkylation response protein AidB-like acyl-CoA dehydrogenase